MDADATICHTMNGPSEFHVIGSLKHWDITGRLREITTPTLLVSGRYTEATPLIVSSDPPPRRGLPADDRLTQSAETSDACIGDDGSGARLDAV
jgi:L-proline amide hydrolase